MLSDIPKPQQSKYWCFTINNPEPTDVLDPSIPVYCVVGEEAGEDGTVHLQGFVVMKTKRTAMGMKKLLPRAHLEIMDTTIQAASDYCKKDGKYSEIGILPPEPRMAGGLATKRKWEEAFIQAKNGDIEKMDKDILVRYYNSVKRIRSDYMKPANNMSNVTGEWYVGEPGTGKSHTARERYPELYDKPCNKWWDGYQNQDVVLLDDFDKNHRVLGHHLKRWADSYSFPAEQKGTTIQIRPKLLIVTSNYSIGEIFEGDDALILALNRRFKVEHFDTVYNK